MTGDPALVLQEAGDFLASDPVRHNVILTLLHTRVAFPQPGSYWIIDGDGETAGVVLQSPLDFDATITPMASEAVRAVVDAIVESGTGLPGVNGEAATAACFAGHWSERTRCAARPWQGQRIYEVDDVTPVVPASGELRQANGDDRDLLVGWYQAFRADIGETPSEVTPVVSRRLGGGQLWFWVDHEPVALAGLSDPVAGAVRVGPVYTPLGCRNRGYASSLVAVLSSEVRKSGDRCILYTDLANPTSNWIYRALGYRAVSEALRYSFDQEHRPDG